MFDKTISQEVPVLSGPLIIARAAANLMVEEENISN